MSVPDYRIHPGSALPIHPTCGMRSPTKDGRCVICALLGKVERRPTVEVEVERVPKKKRAR